ncbi:MAG TPA: hypothetical protein VFI09_09845 [Solirubrobacterales bacterium]|nr:hypothetical protein [Solirubrobacterales bacterium]
MTGEHPRKVVRSYRVVFRRRWRIFRVQNWRVPVPGGIELRAIGYWLACLAALGLFARLPLLGPLVDLLPPSLRLVALPLAAAWALSRAEIDGRSPHRALVGFVAWRLRPRSLAALRRCPGPGAVLAPPGPLRLGPDFGAPRYPRGRLEGPARLLLRYPVRVALEGVPRGAGEGPSERSAAARRWRLSQAGDAPLHRGHTLQVPAGRTVVFEGGPE